MRLWQHLMGQQAFTPVSIAWRISISSTRTTDSFFATLAEFQLRGSVGGANMATGGTASASSSVGSTPASNAFDGIASTIWSSESNVPGPQWLRYQFGSAVSVREIAIQAGDNATRANRAPQNFTVEWFNGSTWVVAYTAPTQSAWSIGEQRVYQL